MLLLLRLAVSRMLDLHGWSAPVSRHLARQPHAGLIVRREAAGGQKQPRCCTSLSLSNPLHLGLLKLLDGTRDGASLLEALRRERPEISDATLREKLEPSLVPLHRTGVWLAEDFAGTAR